VAVIDLNAPASLDGTSTEDSALDLVTPSSASKGSVDVPLVLALQASPINFSVEEIQPEELMTDEHIQAMVNNSSPVNEVGSEGNGLQVGMALLPNDLDVDPVYAL
jgi:hypothetical protein